MEDVLLNYLQSRKTAPASALAATAASWTAPGALQDAANPESESFLRPGLPGLPYPLSALFALIESHREYPDACKDMAEFLKGLCGRHPLEDAMLQVVQSRLPRVWMERFLFILLEVQASDWQTAAYALQFRHLKRLLLRVERQMPLNPAESGLARDLINALSLSRFQDFDPHGRRAADTFRAMQSGRMPASGDLGLLVHLIRCECIAMGERKNWLESESANGDPDAVARLSPHLKLLEERMLKAQDLAQRLGACGPIHDGAMGLEEAMGPFYFGHLKECLGRNAALAGLKEVLELQRAKRVPTRDLIALSTLSRWLLEARGSSAGPIEWVRMALEAYDRGHFRLDVAGGLPAVEALLIEARVGRDGTVVLGHFGEAPYASWIARDGLTRPYRSSNPDRIAPDLRTTVLSNLHREAILLKLLENPKVYGTPGLVECMAQGSRSALVHTAIATRPELHSGAANDRVPIALLRSPVSISAPLLRSLIHPSVIAFSELKSLYRGRSALRHEVAEELHAFLKQAYAP